MDVVERLTLEAAQDDTMLACEHRHRYEFAAGLCGGARVLDLCCGSGYGSSILAAQAQSVVGVDHDVATIDLAGATVGREHENVRFETADAVAYLRGDIAEHLDIVVCFEGLEHLQELEPALELLRVFTEDGGRLIASVPNSRMFGERNPFHITDFGYEEAQAAFARFGDPVMLPQFLAEGSLICPPNADDIETTLSLDGRDEPEYANHFIFFVGFNSDHVARVHHGNIHLNTSPLFNRWSVGMNHAVAALRRENARLSRGYLGKSGSAAASALAKLAEREAQMTALHERCKLAEVRVKELELELQRERGIPPKPSARRSGPVVCAPIAGRIAATAGPGEDPNSWESRHRRAAEVLIPWIEQTVPLAGKTILEYGCGNAAVSCAVAQRAARVIGVDIDADWIEEAHSYVSERGLQNVELELHPVESILEAIHARRGEVDVFLCYAVLEHLTVAERLAVLRLAREVVKEDGAIVVCETPNRLIYFDHHTAQMPFFHLLPDELALDYYPRSTRRDFRAAIDSAASNGRQAALEALARWGRGVSFHEFELVFEAGLERHVIASNYDLRLFGERPVHPDEVILARYLDRWRPDLAPVWSRYWLDLILTPAPLEQRPPFLRPWTAQTVENPGAGWTSSESLYLRADAPLWIDLPHPTGRLVVGAIAPSEPLSLQVRGESMEASLAAEISGPAREQVFVPFELGKPQRRLGLSSDRPVEVVLVAYED